MSKAIFLDRDGTIINDPGYVHKPEDLVILPGAIKGLRLLNHYKLFIITNQSGIGRGYFTKEEFLTFNNLLLEELSKNGITIEDTYYCPHKPDDGCDCRKPSVGFIKDAVKEYKIDLSKSYVIGDKPVDIEMGIKAECKTIFVLTGHGKKHQDSLKIKPDVIVNDLFEGAKYINQNDKLTLDNRNKILTIGNIEQNVLQLKEENKAIVTCNGTFDILHIGHIKFLEEAKQKGDILIVGLNSDESVRNNKGPDRPINNERNRAEFLAALVSVDYVVIFNEEDPRKLLSIIKPDFHVNGNEYGYDCIEADVVKKNGGKIHLFKNYGGFSTTKLLQTLSCKHME